MGCAWFEEMLWVLGKSEEKDAIALKVILILISGFIKASIILFLRLAQKPQPC